MRLIDADALKEDFGCVSFYDYDDYKKALRIIDNAPTVEQITVFTETADEKAVADLKAELQNVLDARLQGDIRWTDKLSVKSNGDIIDFEGRVVGHINLEDIKGGTK